MPIHILMPALSPTMEEGRLAKWLVSEGDAIVSGKIIAEIETDKATMEVEAVDEGIVERILVAAGTDHVKVNAPIAILRLTSEAATGTNGGGMSAAGSKSSGTSAAGNQSSGTSAAGNQSSGTSAAGSQSSGTSAAGSQSSGTSASGNKSSGTSAAGSQSSGTSAAGSQSSGTSAAGIKSGADPSLRGRASETAMPAPTRAASDAGRRMAASPLARRLAREGGLNLTVVVGTGPHGRIVRRDVESALAAGRSGGEAAPLPAAAASAVVATARSGGEPTATPLVPQPAATLPFADDKILALYEPGAYEIVPHDGMRRVIAQRLVQSKQTIPHFYLTIDCRLDTLLAARTRMNAAAPKEGPRAYKLSVNDFLIKALALALQQVPPANATWTEAGMLRHKASDVGVAVAVEGGLFTPVVRHAELKSMSEISNEMKDLAERARRRRLAPHEYQGGTTSISNLGMYGITAFDAVINPPHATILAIGAGEKRPIVVEDRIEVGTVMSCTLSCDHRVVDGAIGAALLAAFKAYVEDPVRMLV